MSTSSILQQQAERKAKAEADAARAKAHEQDGSTRIDSPTRIDSTVRTGIDPIDTDPNAPNPNANATGGSTAVRESKEEAKAPEQNPKTRDKIPAPDGGYKDVGLRQFMKADGSKIVPNAEGYFVPKTQEEFDLLEHYAERNELVNRPEEGKRL